MTIQNEPLLEINYPSCAMTGTQEAKIAKAIKAELAKSTVLKDNEKEVSCIPEGCYEVRLEDSLKFGRVYRVYDVEGRTGILIHPANFVSELKGCIAIGEIHRYKNSLVDSRDTLVEVLKLELSSLEIVRI